MKFPDVTPFINCAIILRQVLTGINKEFGQIGENEIIHPEEDPTFDRLVNLLLPALDKLYHQDHQKFLALLYRVDISEAMLMKARENNKDGFFIKEVAILIVKRELQKVVIRNFFKSRHGNNI